MIWKRLKKHYQDRGFSGLIKAIKTKLLVIWRDRRLINHYFFHGGIGDNIVLRVELERWKYYCMLRKKYKKLIESFPYYKSTGIRNKTIWWCWLQGEDKAPALCKACLRSLRQHLTDYDIVVITNNNMLDYVHPPKYIIEKFRMGIVTMTHFSDLLRTMLLVEHGGVWIDSTVYCTGFREDYFNEPLFLFKNLQLAGSPSIVASSWLISSEKGHPILRSIQDLLFLYWKENNKLIHYFLFHLFFHMTVEKYHELWNEMPCYSNIPPHFLQHDLFKPYEESLASRIRRQSDFHKLSYKDSRLDGDISGLMVEKILNNEL